MPSVDSVDQEIIDLGNQAVENAHEQLELKAFQLEVEDVKQKTTIGLRM